MGRGAIWPTRPVDRRARVAAGPRKLTTVEPQQELVLPVTGIYGALCATRMEGASAAMPEVTCAKLNAASKRALLLFGTTRSRPCSQRW